MMEKTSIAPLLLFVSRHTAPLRLAQEESMAKATTQDVLLEAYMKFAGIKTLLYYVATHSLLPYGNLVMRMVYVSQEINCPIASFVKIQPFLLLKTYRNPLHQPQLSYIKNKNIKIMHVIRNGQLILRPLKTPQPMHVSNVLEFLQQIGAAKRTVLQ